MNKRILCFFTNSYPYGKGETFIENELNYIAPSFDTIFLFHKSNEGIAREVPPNVKLIYIDKPVNISKTSILKGNFLLLSGILIKELFFSRQKGMFISNFRYNLLHLINCIYYSIEIKKNLTNDILKSAYFYSYWFFDWNLSLSMLKSKNVISKNFTRAHGFDLYEDNGKPNYLPSRNFCFGNTDKVFTISHVGENYLKQLYPKFEHKILCSYLGTKDHGENPLPIDKNVIHIVSCSNVNYVKRLHLIVEALKHFDTKVVWTHLGDGVLLDDIKNRIKVLPENISVKFKGRVTQKQIFEFYKETPIDVFINCSVSEGLPVSIMEAISFGIPVIATNVGGTQEIVNSITGCLIGKDFDTKALAEKITYVKKHFVKTEVRNDIRLFWKNNFECTNNYSSFIKNFNRD